MTPCHPFVTDLDVTRSMELVTEATAVDDVTTVTALLSEAESENFALVHTMKDLNNEVLYPDRSHSSIHGIRQCK